MIVYLRKHLRLKDIFLVCYDIMAYFEYVLDIFLILCFKYILGIVS
jgi:hypothetical protein